MKQQLLLKERFSEYTAAILIFLFTYTAVSKMTAYGSYVDSLRQSPLLKNYADIISWLVPAVEVLVALLLLIKKHRLTGFYGSLFLLVLFTVYVGYMILFVPHLPCSCGGIIQQLSWKQHLLLNAILLLLTCLAIVSEHLKKLSYQPMV